MSVKHVIEYYDQIYAQYREMEADLKDLEEAVSVHLVGPEQYEQTVAQLEKLKENYQRINYIIFLLNMPNRKEKIPAYKRRLNAKFKQMDNATLDKVKEENQKCLDQFEQGIQQIIQQNV